MHAPGEFHHHRRREHAPRPGHPVRWPVGPDNQAIKPNLDYPSGPAYNLIGFDTEMFTPLFVASRITGWTAHIMEQLASNALIRPLSVYNGVDERHIVA